jgi:ubiquinone/menaquinone biosynthesis C-methylase UbiE
MYARLRPAMDRQGAAAHRRRLLAGLSGRVVEVGAGDGGNFACYPARVTGVVAVEPEPYLRERAGEQAAAAPVPVEVVDGVADRLPLGDGSVDAAVVSLVLCSVPDQAAALAELRRVLRPGGELRFYEHVAAETPGLRRLQAVADRTVWPLVLGGCHTGRDTVGAIGAAGFAVEEVRRFRFPEGALAGPASPHVLGRARRP